MTENKRHLELSEQLLLKVYSTQVLYLAKEHLKSLPEDLRKESSLETAIQKIHQELDITENLVKHYYK